MDFYDFDDICAAGDCQQLARDLYNAEITNNRCAATWRGGDNREAVAIDKDKWYDHVTKTGGSIIQLAEFNFDGDTQQAQQYLGELYSLTPSMKTGSSSLTSDCRYQRLKREGYTETAQYRYFDLTGQIRHVTIRMEHPSNPKQFVQGHPEGETMRWTLKGVDTILYRLPEIVSSSWVLICEGEKSADALAALNLPSTTVPMGAGKWQDSYTTALIGKHVAIAPDNDEPGREHAKMIAQALSSHVKSVKIIGPLSAAPKGGIDDWITESTPHKTRADIISLISNTPAIGKTQLAGSGPSASELEAAKTANSIPFRNYIPNEVEVIKKGKTKPSLEIVKEPRTHQMMLDDLATRFLSFPRKVGDSWLFDHDRDSSEIIHISDCDDLVSWIARRSKKNPDFARSDATVTPRQLMSSIRATTRRYEAISLTPDFPKRSDIYYAHGPIPAPCPNHSRFKSFLDFFLPATPEDRALIATFACAPLWYIPGIDRPSWIIDSRDGQGSGKTNLAELISDLYGAAPISTSRQELSQRMDVLIKRCICQSGRKARMMLVDNITGEFQSAELADLITRKDITGIAPYGRGEEVRPNNLIFVLTANSATVNHDLADRSFYIHLIKAELSERARATWKSRVQAYISAHRLEIIADIIDLLSNHTPFETAPRTRFAAFEQSILQPCCQTPEMYDKVCASLKEAKEESNVEQDQAQLIAEMINFQIAKETGSSAVRPVFIQTKLVNSWGRNALQESYDYKHAPIQLIRQLCKAGFLPQMDKEVRRWPTSSKSNRVSGIAWNFSDSTEQAVVLTRDADKMVQQELI